MELGASATMGTLLKGMALGIPTVDSDYVGRAIPEAGQSKMDLAGFLKGVGGPSYLAQIRDAKKGFVRGSLLKAIEVGRALREGVGTPAPLGPLRTLTSGTVLFTGEAVATDWDDSESYVFRKFTYRIRGTGRHAGQSCGVWVKNEHHV